MGFRKLGSEQLQRREMMAGDLVAIKLETLNMAGESVSHVAVGEQFTLRASAKDLRSAGGVFAAFTDVTFNGDLVQPPQTLTHSPAVTTLRSGIIHPSQIDEAGGVTAAPISANDFNRMNVVLWEANFVAALEGEVVFASNPVEDPRFEVLLLNLNDPIDPQNIDFGFTRLLIGNGQPSPWTNPQNPADVNEDGEVTQADIEVLTSQLGAAESVALPINGLTSLVDVDANRSLTIADLQLVRDQIVPEKPPVSNPDPSPVWKDEDFSFTVKNLRTGLTSGEIAEGDIVEVEVHFGAARWQNGLDRLPQFLASSSALASGTSPFTFDPNILSATTPATVELTNFFFNGIDVVPTTLSARFMAKSAGQTALKVDSSVFPIFDSATAPVTTLQVSVIPAGVRPQAHPVEIVLPFDEWTVAETSRVFLSEEFKVVAKFDAARGILANNAGSQSHRALLIRDAKHGHVTLNSDGSFAYAPTYELTDGDSFEYVVMSNEGTSTVQTVQLLGAYPAIVDLQVSYTNAAGEKVDRVKRGETFYVDVSILTFIGYDPDSVKPLRADFSVGSIDSRGEALPNRLFDHNFLSLGTDENRRLTLVTTVYTPTADVGTNSLNVNAEYLRLQTATNRPESLIRIPIAAHRSGQFDLQLDKLVVGDLRADSIHIGMADLEVVEGDFRHNVASPLDVNADGQLSPLDALLGINMLNRRSETSGEAPAVGDAYFYDASGDGVLSPLDILLVINALNARSTAEGEQAVVAQSIDHAFAIDIGEEDILTFGKRKSRR